MSTQREYIITLREFKDLENFYKDMENPGGSPYMPSRAVPVHLRRDISCNTHYYLTDSEAELLKQDPRVLDVSLTMSESGKQVKLFYTQSSNNWNKNAVTSSNLEKNWGLLRCYEGVQRAGWGVGGTFQNASGTINIPYSGQNVDIVIADGLINWTHPEFTTNSNGTGPSRVVRYNWLKDRPALGFGSAGNYNYSASSLDESNHGTHVAGIAAGNTQGWARGANIYNIGISGENGISPEQVFDYIRYWHNNKPINPVTGRKNPTIINCSFGIINVVPIANVISVNYQGVTYTGPFTASQLNSYEIYTNGSNTFTSVPFSSLESDIAQAINDGIIVVGAAGNEGIRISRNPADSIYNNSLTTLIGSLFVGTIPTQRGSIGASNNVICVGSISEFDDDSKSDYSVCGPRVDVFAPGNNIMSAYLSGSVRDPRNMSYRIAKASGTSSSSPQVAGLLACIMEPLQNLTQEQAISYIQTTGKTDQITNYPGSGNYYGYDLLGSPNRYLYAETNVVATLTVPQDTYGLLINELATPFTPVVPVGGLSPFTFSISPALPTGLVFNTSTGSISGTPSVLLSSTEYTISVTDNINYTTDQTFNLVVANELIAIQSIPIRELIITSQPIDPFIPVTFSGGYGNKTVSISPSLPAGLTINPLTGSISGIPTESISNVTYTVTITDEVGQTSSETFVFSLEVYKQSFTLTEETYINQPIQDLTSSTTYKVISGKLPPSLTLTSNGYLTGTVDPVLNTLNYKFVVRATSNSGTISDKTFSIDVEGNDPPVWDTSSTNYLNVGPFGEPWALNYQYVNFEFNANAPGFNVLPTPYKLRYFIKDNNGTLPPGLTLSDNGVLSGFLEDTLVFDGDENNQGYDTNRYDIFSYDFGVNTNSIDKTPIPKIYTFTVTVSDGVKESNSTFGILVVNPEIIRSTSSNLLSIPSSILVTNTNYVPPIQFIDKNDLGEVRSATSQILNTQGYDPYPLLGTVTYFLSTTTDILTQLPNYLTLDPTSGYISGFIPYQPAYTKNYSLTINATKTYNSSTVISTNTFLLAIKGLVESSIEWISSSTLPNLLAGELSEISFKAKELTNDYKIKYLLKSGSFPEGLTLGQDGSLFGRASTSTIGTTFTATVIASDVYNLSSIEKTFTLTIDDPETEYTQIYFKPFLHPTKRTTYQEFVNNEDIFPKDYLYRFYDPNFGIQQEIKMFLEFGIEKLNIDDYVDALYENFYRKNLYFGDIKIAVAADLNNNPLYELVYVDVKDTLINNDGVSISPVIYVGNEILYPNSIPNMKNSLRSIVMPDYSLIKTNDRYLPRFMKTAQPSTSQVTGFISVIPICYALPGNGKKIISRINASNFDFKQFNFTVDRIILENTLDSNTAKYLIFGRQEITDDLSVDDLLRGSDGIILQTETFDSLER